MMEASKINRRRFFKRVGLAGAATLALGTTEARYLEPQWLKVRHVRISPEPPVCRFAFFTDLHYKGDRAYVQSVVDTINALNPDFVCFGGDLIEKASHLPEALEMISLIKAPLYGVPGNHDYWSQASFEPYQQTFSTGGGAWLINEQRELAGGRVNLIGLTCEYDYPGPLPLKPQAKNIVLLHYPVWADKFKHQDCDLLLAGHSHGGQVRLPFIGPLILPGFVGQYDLGLFQTEAGPLYVNPGIGWLHVDVRFNCRPEITVFEV